MPAYHPPIIPLTHECMFAAAARQQLPVAILYALMQKEGGRIGAVSHNKNGSDDLGVFQINTRWVPLFSRYGISASDLIYNGCTNAYAAAWLLKREIIEAGGDFWKGVGNYHSHTFKYHEPYKIDVYKKAVHVQQMMAGVTP